MPTLCPTGRHSNFQGSLLYTHLKYSLGQSAVCALHAKTCRNKRNSGEWSSKSEEHPESRAWETARTWDFSLCRGMPGFPGGSVVKNPPANAGDTGNLGSILGSGRSPGEGSSNPLQCSCLENSIDGGASWATVHGVSRSWTGLKRLRTGTEGSYCRVLRKSGTCSFIFWNNHSASV